MSPKARPISLTSSHDIVALTRAMQLLKMGRTTSAASNKKLTVYLHPVKASSSYIARTSCVSCCQPNKSYLAIQLASSLPLHDLQVSLHTTAAVQQQQQLYFGKTMFIWASCAEPNPHRTKGCCDSAHLDTPGFEAALQQLCFRSKAAQQVAVLIHSSHCVQVVMHQPAQGHLQDQRLGKVRQSKARQGKAEQGGAEQGSAGPGLYGRQELFCGCVSQHAVLWYAMLCCAVLCCAVLCCAMLRCGMQGALLSSVGHPPY